MAQIQIKASENARSTTPSGSTGVTSTASSSTQQYLNDYNTNRENKIRDMYSASQQATDAGLKSAYDKNMAAAQRSRDDISPQYQNSMNELSAEYERQRRNNNMQAAANGLNTGAGSQMQLGQMNAYQQSQGRLATSENEALNNANQNILDLQTDYRNRAAEAIANNNYQLAAALLDEYGAQYDRTMAQASQLAEFGDFSLYANIYGPDAAQQMEKNWALQNPDLAYNLGKMTSDEYFQMTGRQPRGYSGASGGSGSLLSFGGTGSGSYVATGIGGLSSGGYRSAHGQTGGGYSSSRDRAYRGPAGYYTEDGNFYVPATGKTYGSAPVTTNDAKDDAYAANLAKAYGWTEG